MGALLDKPVTDKSTDDKEGNDLRFGASAMQGWRVEMEDSHTIVPAVDRLPDHSFVAVYDGHGGAASANFAGKHMLTFVQRTAEYKAYVEAGSKAEALDQLELALRKAFLEIDEAMRNEPDAVNGNDRSGCTALVAFITPHAVVIAHAGDSRGILRRSGGVVLATEDHKPYNDEERRRIEAAGGSVSMKRVDGDLAVSRALGDFQYKEEKYPPEDRKVTALPEVKRYERTKNDELLVLCCDGIWDVMSNEECARELGSIFDEGEGSLGVACEELLDMCLHKGSRDNMSAVIVAFPALKYGSGEGVAGRRKQRAAEQAGDSQDDLGEQNTGEFSS